MKGLIFKRDLGLISGIYDRIRNNLLWQEMPYIEGIRSPFLDIPVECKKQLEATQILVTILSKSQFPVCE